MKVEALRVFGSPLIALLVSAAAFAQVPGAPAPGTSGYSYALIPQGTIIVYLRTEDGQPLPQKLRPMIAVVPAGSNAALGIPPSMVGEGWQFAGVAVGADYEVRVVAEGYQPGREIVRLPNVPGASSEAIVFMHPVDQEIVFHRPTGQFALAPKAAKEIQASLHDLQFGKFPSAQKHAVKAIQIAPENPYVQYVMGMTYLLKQQWKEAKPYLEQSVSIDPRQPLSLTALGTARYALGEDAGAVDVLSKSVQLDATSWKTEWLLGASYLGESKFLEARDHADQALKIGQEKAGQARLVLGRALAGLGEREAAAKEFDTFASRYPNDPNAAKAMEWAKLMRTAPEQTPVSSLLVGSTSMALAPPVEVPPRAKWAPPDIDDAKPFVVSTATCPLEQILKSAGRNAEKLVSTLQEFTASEDFQAVEIKPSGELKRPLQNSFSYLVFIDQVSPEALAVAEYRSEGTSEAQLPGSLMDLGVPSLALVFHPTVRGNLEWKCEGLGTWNDEPAWVLHFQQQPSRPNVLASFSTQSKHYPLPLKGRAWVSEKESQVLHLESDLVKEVQRIDLKRQHFSIDYKPVVFSGHNTELWLPQIVDTYIQYKGRFFHNYHRFSNFKLFSVASEQKIDYPKEASKVEQ